MSRGTSIGTSLAGALRESGADLGEGGRAKQPEPERRQGPPALKADARWEEPSPLKAVPHPPTSGCGVLGEILVLIWSEPAAATSTGGVADFLRSVAEGSSPQSHGFALEGNLRSLDWAMKALLRLSPRWGIILESTMAWGLVVGGFSVWLLRCLARGRCGQFGNDDASSRVWVEV
jgi:hypothetical protein